MKQYKVALLGCGPRGTLASLGYKAHPRTEVVGVCDIDEERLHKLGDILNVNTRYTDADTMLSELKPDIVIIPTRTDFHFPLSKKVLEFGANIDVEKPMCHNLDEADILLNKARETGYRISVHHQGRVGTAFRAVQKAINAGKIGKLRYIFASGKGYYGGYGLLNIGVHSLSYLIGHAGKCTSLHASVLTDGRPIAPDDIATLSMGTLAGEHITATLEFESGITGNLLHQRFAEVNNHGCYVELFGTEGKILWNTRGAWIINDIYDHPDDFNSTTTYFRSNNSQWERLPDEIHEDFDPSSNADANEFWYVDEYVKALDTNTQPTTNGNLAMHITEIMMGIFESGAYRKRVNLPQQKRDHPLERWAKETNTTIPKTTLNYRDWLEAEDKRLGR